MNKNTIETKAAPFVILRDETVNVRDGEVYLLVTKDESKFYFEVHNKNTAIGKKETKNHIQAIKVLECFKAKLEKYNYMEEVEYSVRFCMSYPSVNECVFALKVRDCETKYTGMLPIANMCNVDLITYVDLEEDETAERSVSIQASYEGKCIGVWRGRFLKEGFKFFFNHNYT